MDTNTQQQPVCEIMTVTRTQRLTPHYIRVYLTGQAETISNMAKMIIGVNNKILIPNTHSATLDLDDKSSFTVRTYTHRGVDVEKREICIDFVAHGDHRLPLVGRFMLSQVISSAY